MSFWFLRVFRCSGRLSGYGVGWVWVVVICDLFVVGGVNGSVCGVENGVINGVVICGCFMVSFFFYVSSWVVWIYGNMEIIIFLSVFYVMMLVFWNWYLEKKMCIFVEF